MTPPRVTALILTWNSGQDALHCLADLTAQDYPALHILVVDNASADGTPDRIAAQFPQVELLRQPRNLGYAEGNNVGMRHALQHGADFVLLLNPDTRVPTTDCVTRLAHTLQAHPQVGILGPALVSPRDPTRVYAGARLFPRTADVEDILYTAPTADAAAAVSTDLLTTAYVPGCALLVRRELIDAVGMFDPRYFAYYEDVDWCVRAQRAGFAVMVAPDVRVIHHNTADIHGTTADRSIYYPRRNQFLFLRIHQPGQLRRALRIILRVRVREFRGLMTEGLVYRAHTLVAGVWDGLWGVTGPGAGRPSWLALALAWLLALLQMLGESLRRSPEPRVQRIMRFLQHTLRPRTTELARPLPARLPAAPPVSVVGYVSAASGLGETARGSIRALQHMGHPVHYLDLTPTPTVATVELPPNPQPLPATRITLLHVNAVNVAPTHRQLAHQYFRGEPVVGVWYWEMPTFPSRWYGTFDLFDEIWVGSRYTQACLAAVSPVPIVHMPPLVQPAPPAPRTRAALGLPDDRFIFLFAFDALSIFPRKNPHAIVRAFELAFGAPTHGPLLVLKLNNTDHVRQQHAELGLAQDYLASLTTDLARVNGRLIDQRLDRATTSALMAAADAYISLHRCEGFGMTLAEAMWFGKPCIATAYSGNLDFMTPSNSYPVGYHLVELDRDWGPYPAGDHWAEPDIHHAAARMQQIVADPDAAAARGRPAAADIRRLYGPDTVGPAMQQRLRLLMLRRARAARSWRRGG